MEVMNNGHTTQVKEIFAQSAVASPVPLPSANMGQVFDANAFS
jgi:hypothetical protein